MSEFIDEEPQYEEGKRSEYHQVKLPEDHEHDKNLFIKVYETLLTNMAVQNGMKKINKISQPIIDIYHDLLDDRISDFKHKGQEVINTTKERLTSWLYNVNIYSHLVGLWIFQNTPHTKTTMPEEEFLKAFETFSNSRKKGLLEQDTEVAKDFYHITSQLWSSLSDPTSEDIKNTLLHAVAKTIGKGVGAKDGFYAGNLVHNFKDLVENKKELVSHETFIEIVKGMTGNAWIDDTEYRRGANDFYVFAKRFTLVDLPLIVSTKSVSQALVSYLQEVSRRYADSALNFIELYLNAFMLVLGMEIDNEKEGASLVVRSRNVMDKVAALAKASLESTVNYGTSTQLYITADSYIHFRERFDDISYIGLMMFDLMKANVYQPTKQFIHSTYDQTTKAYTVILEGLNTEVVKDKLMMVKEGYEYLKEATFYLKDKILEIKFDRESLENYKEQITMEVVKLYEELKTLDIKKKPEKLQKICTKKLWPP